MTDTPNIAIGAEFTIPGFEYVKQRFEVKRIVGEVVIAHDKNEKLGNRLAWPISYGFNERYLMEKAKWEEAI